ncbi:hypothetical protein OSB04_012386 [Centaurea solstitialis]|uniref:Uncharacterized protein n=1 Tax=Centaurea solstitialis TaxID=347529 RepID=A0AA38TUC2_9ASTR|nr:hypothetical protein OSB04_012386 [Centaurea solstitialis]
MDTMETSKSSPVEKPKSEKKPISGDGMNNGKGSATTEERGWKPWSLHDHPPLKSFIFIGVVKSQKSNIKISALKMRRAFVKSCGSIRSALRQHSWR